MSDPTKNNFFKHGYALRGKKTPEYICWEGMKRRCFNKKNKDYKYYGGRGITVCERWKLSFVNFLKDVGEKPSKKHSLDRIDVNGNYEKKNCRWLTQDLQMLNARITTNESKIRGLSKKLSKGKWNGNYQVMIGKKYLGFTNDPTEGGIIYDKAALKIYGENAFLNFPKLKNKYLKGTI